MASNDVRSRTITFMAVQSAILGVIMLAFVVLASALFVKNATRWQLRNVEDVVLMFARQAARSGEIPKRGDLGAYTFFILTQDGKYVLPRLSRSDDTENLWQEYEHKLIYEMQKRREGWIFYPERTRSGLREGQNVIRYIYLEQQGWIVAAEGYVSSGWSMLQGFLTPKLFLGLFLIVGAAFGMMLLSAFWHFRKVMKAILKAQENNFIAAPAKPPSEAVFVKREETMFSDGVIQGASTRSLPRTRQEPLKPEFDSDSPVLPEPDEKLLRRDEARPLPSDARMRGKSSVPGPRQLDNLGAMTIDTTDIRSPILRQAIEQMREEKK